MNTILLVLIGIVAVSILFTVSVDFLKQKSEVSQARIDLLEETARMKKVVIDPEDPSKIHITFCCAQGKVVGSQTTTSGGVGSETGTETSGENSIFDVGLVLDRSKSMINSGWTINIDPLLNPIEKFENIPISEGDFGSPQPFEVPEGTERLAILLEWSEIEGYHGSKGSEFAQNPRSPENNKRIFGNQKPSLNNIVDPPSEIGGSNQFFSGISTMPQVVYIENPYPGTWQAEVYGWQFRPSSHPGVQNVNITIYIGNSDELIRNPTIIAFNASKESSKNFIKSIREEDRASITLFGDNSPLINSFTSVKSTLLNSIDFLDNEEDTQPGTRIDLGIEKSTQEFVDNSRIGAKKIMVILTDGQNDEGPQAVVDAANLAKAEEIQIYTIGLGNLVDEDLLKQIASDESYYYFASDSSILEDVFNSVITRIIREGYSISLSDGFKIVFYNGTHSYSPEYSGINLEPLQIKTYTFDISGHITNLTKVETYPIKIVNGQEIMGPLIQTYKF